MKLIYNAIQTPDGTILESRHQHDYKTYVDKLTEEVYMVDGGLEYQRSSVNIVPAKNLAIYLEDGVENYRNVVTWGTRGKLGDKPLRYVKLSEMATEHIEACLETQTHMHPHYKQAFRMELVYRELTSHSA